MRLPTARSILTGVPLLVLLGAARTQSTQPRVTARDRVGAADTTCDDLCRRERRLDRLYGRDRERLHGGTAQRAATTPTTTSTTTPVTTPAAKPGARASSGIRVRKTVP